MPPTGEFQEALGAWSKRAVDYKMTMFPQLWRAWNVSTMSDNFVKEDAYMRSKLALVVP